MQGGRVGECLNATSITGEGGGEGPGGGGADLRGADIASITPLVSLTEPFDHLHHSLPSRQPLPTSPAPPPPFPFLTRIPTFHLPSPLPPHLHHSLLAVVVIKADEGGT